MHKYSSLPATQSDRSANTVPTTHHNNGASCTTTPTRYRNTALETDMHAADIVNDNGAVECGAPGDQEYLVGMPFVGLPSAKSPPTTPGWKKNWNACILKSSSCWAAPP